MSKTNNRVVAGVAVAAISLTLAGTASALAGSETQDARAGALSKAEQKAVKKIVRKEIKKAAPKLRVASAASADRATTAGRADTAAKADAATWAGSAAMADMATNAQNAANAAKVGGLDVKKINVVVPSGGAAVALITSAPFTLTATCAGGAPELTAAASPAGGRLRVARIDNAEDVNTGGDSNLSTAGIIGAGANGLGSVTAEYVSPAGQVINIWLGYRNDAPGCAFFGNYMVG